MADDRPTDDRPTDDRPTDERPTDGHHTFLFADLVGFTALAELEGDDRALEVVLGLQRRARSLLDDHGAEQVKTIGDGLMLRVQEPDCAIKLGLRLVDGLAGEADFPPVRVGIHTGPALANDGDYYGRTVNVAARLCAVAPGGEVMVSEQTRTAAGSVTEVSWGERELHWLRNVPEPVATYLAAAEPELVAQEPPQRRRRRAPWRGCGRAAAGKHGVSGAEAFA